MSALATEAAPESKIGAGPPGRNSPGKNAHVRLEAGQRGRGAHGQRRRLTLGGYQPRAYNFLRSVRISFAARTPSEAPPSMKPWKLIEQCSPAKWMFPCRTFS